MKKQTVMVVIGVLASALLLCALLFQVVFRQCLWWECAPQRSFTVRELELPARFFPSGAIVNSLSPLSDSFDTIEDGGQTIYWNDGIAIYWVQRHPTVKTAAKKFADSQLTFVDRVTKEPWSLPPELATVKITADELFLGCGSWQEYRCAMVARYAEYVVQFNAVISPGMTYQDFEQIVEFIDKQLSERLHP